jgi:outer membrane protein
MSDPVRRTGFTISLLLATSGAAIAFADAPPAPSSPWFGRAGVAGVFYDSSASIETNGEPLPGASVSVSNNETVTFDIGYDLTRHVAVSLLLGAPPKPTIAGDGTIASLGELGRVRFGPVILTGSYRFRPAAAFRPYAGLGMAYVIIFNEYDGAVEDLDVHDNWAYAAQAGAEYRLSPKCDFFVDLKHLWLDLDADGFLAGGIPLTAKVTLDPLLVTVGVKFRFD